MKKSARAFLLTLILTLACPPGPARPCTLWIALAERVQGGGALVAKTRDMPPNHLQEVRLERPPGGFRFVGLYAATGSRQGLKDGINEKGLVILSSAASCLSQAERNRFPGPPDLLERLLAQCDGVEAVLRHLERFTHPAFYLLADPRQAAVIEVGLNHQRRVRVVDRGALTHTNHYLEPAFQELNRGSCLSSSLRLQRIAFLLGRHRGPLTLADSVAFTEDRKDGPRCSIWRWGGSPKKVRTLAAWVSHWPRQGAPVLYLKLANPGQTVRTLRLTLDEAFWRQGAKVF
ncbi:MAG: hypothetical protein FJ128_14365 [Deltaproteobacteria bacterium]|nr:hypothetical protein [Deltaproteobacteria bacterium]